MSRKVAVVTGGGRGIGRAHSLVLAERGYTVVVNDLGVSLAGGSTDETPAQQVVAEIESRGGEAVASDHDVSDWAAAGDLINSTVDRFGHLDVLINNAGIIRDTVLYKMDASSWDDVIRVHLRATAATSHFAAAHWRERFQAEGEFGGRLINTASPSVFSGNPGQTNYTAAKGGIIALTLTASLELGRYGVTANAIAPGAASRMLAAIMTESQMAALDPVFVARVAASLCTPEAQSVTGRVFAVMGEHVFLAEGWKAGPSMDIPMTVPVDDVTPILTNMIATPSAPVPTGA
ncbi:SDR family NAD(P)-dependent oxidoreductase [Frankia sp. CNm7]|uniref:SDR family NAD(P)-dependent oxidoreductase n=1 Tax=Frankia nepalensis TaxID=1836974 RepID=A0A937RL40_9ACTN|nr:SDR family NAD(P)-dependent oxidoreductase [Frankia nepalensis]MBL7495074.1 SDR family NAD(P)-dependent oxidoreductase [Frankia nepalensis]MBL7515324.1 SDR family NAD(P)-dependent oxidoreductase [Frankia nepalensis]MBL7522311.1 SDR family NAD(P)-dependent oxidoreductase [Frankia nepalensis]MBL7632307.1 SDR family NAD(P)-dependent oxidoreductase [Frankia nepalensis]